MFQGEDFKIGAWRVDMGYDGMRWDGMDGKEGRYPEYSWGLLNDFHFFYPFVNCTFGHVQYTFKNLTYRSLTSLLLAFRGF